MTDIQRMMDPTIPEEERRAIARAMSRLSGSQLFIAWLVVLGLFCLSSIVMTMTIKLCVIIWKSL